MLACVCAKEEAAPVVRGEELCVFNHWRISLPRSVPSRPPPRTPLSPRDGLLFVPCVISARLFLWERPTTAGVALFEVSRYVSAHIGGVVTPFSAQWEEKEKEVTIIFVTKCVNSLTLGLSYCFGFTVICSDVASGFFKEIRYGCDFIVRVCRTWKISILFIFSWIIFP